MTEISEDRLQQESAVLAASEGTAGHSYRAAGSLWEATRERVEIHGTGTKTVVILDNPEEPKKIVPLSETDGFVTDGVEYRRPEEVSAGNHVFLATTDGSVDVVEPKRPAGVC